MHRNRTILAVPLLILAMALCAGTSYAQGVVFTFNLSCNTNNNPNCPTSNLFTATAPGGEASDRVTIATVANGAGGTPPISIGGGLLSFTSSPATQGACSPDGNCAASYGTPGGNVSIVGSVFGLPAGSTLLTASFQGAYSRNDENRSAYYEGSIVVSFINPVILQHLGLSGSLNYGTGTLQDQYISQYDNNGIEMFGVYVSFGAASSYSVIHNFTGGVDGAAPSAGLTIDSAGNFYGTAWAGGAGSGTAFKLIRKGSGWTFNPLYSFAGGNDGSHPGSPVIIGSDGSIYGTTEDGGSGKCYSSGYPG